MSDMVPVHMPYLGESIIEATVSRWLKDLGDYVEADQPVLEVFTDKVEVQVPAPVSGHLHDIVVTVDETVLVGSTLGVIEVGGQPQAVTTPEAGRVHSIPKSFYLLAPKWIVHVIEPTVSRWYKAEGDGLTLGDPILDINTEYADIQVRCPVNGILRNILVDQDDAIAPGDALAFIETETRDILK